MPVRSLNSSVLKWPDQSTVDRAVRSWAKVEAENRPEVLKIGYFGSYARKDPGVGSDLDMIVIVDQAEEPFERRAVKWDLAGLPVPAELLVYTEEEFRRILECGGECGGRFARVLQNEVVWVHCRRDAEKAGRQEET